MLIRIDTYEKRFTGRLNGEDNCELVLVKSNNHVLINVDAISSIEIFERDNEEYALIKMVDSTKYIIKNYELSCLLQSGKIKSA